MTYVMATLQHMRRFLATCTLNDTSETVVAHLPNTGSMRTLNAVGNTVWLQHHADTKRKTAYTVHVVCDAYGEPVGVYSAQANTIVAQALQQNLWPTLAGYTQYKREAKFAGTNSRFDFFAHGHITHAPAYIEVKSVQMLRKTGLAEFPDAVTARGLKHLEHLTQAVTQGYRGVLILCAQRADAARVGIAHDIDPAYGQGILRAQQAGVEILACRCRVTNAGVSALEVIPSII